MMVLTAMICLVLAVAIAAAAFIYGRQIGRTIHEIKTVKQHNADLQELLSARDLEYRQLEIQYEQMLRDQRVPPKTRGWDPGQMMERG